MMRGAYAWQLDRNNADLVPLVRRFVLVLVVVLESGHAE
jgi:hypothetical protein